MNPLKIKKPLLVFVTALWVCFILISPETGFSEPLHPNEDPAAEFEDFADKGDPFAGIDADIPDEALVPVAVKPFQFGGSVETEAQYGFQKKDQKLSMLKTTLFLEGEYRLNSNYKFKASGQAGYDFSYDLEAKEKHDGWDPDYGPYYLELRDFYLDGNLGERFSVRLGRQIIAWGVSDYTRVTDVVNPRDLTQPGLIDLEDQRLPVTAARLTATFKAWSFNLATIHEHPGSRIAAEGDDFDYYISLRNPAISINEKNTPSVGLENTGVAFKATHSFNGGDISFIAAHTYDDQPYLRYEGLSNNVMVFTPEYEKLTTWGFSSSLARGSSLFKFEAAFRQNRKIMRNDVLAQIAVLPAATVATTRDQNQLTVLGGIEYTGFSDLRLSLELEMVHTLDHQDYLIVDENEYCTYFQATRDMFNETLALDLLWVHMWPGHGNILRLSGTYDIWDNLSLEAGIAWYDAADDSAELSPYKDQDRIYIRGKYSF